MHRNNERKWTAGKKSLLYLGGGGGAVALSMMIVPSEGLPTIGGLLGIPLMMAGVPLLVMSFIFSGLAIMDNNGRKQGIAAASCFLLGILVANIIPFV